MNYLAARVRRDVVTISFTICIVCIVLVVAQQPVLGYVLVNETEGFCLSRSFADDPDDGVTVLTHRCRGTTVEQFGFWSLQGIVPTFFAPWWPETYLNIEIRFSDSGQCLDIDGGETRNGARLQQFHCNRTRAQVWEILPDTDGFSIIRNPQSGKCLTYVKLGCSGGSICLEERQYATIWDCHGGSDQRWQIAQPFSLRAQHSGQCLDVPASSVDRGTPVQQYPCHQGANQLWYWRPYYYPSTWPTPMPAAQLVSLHSGLCLDAPDDIPGYPNVDQWTCLPIPTQRWTILTTPHEDYRQYRVESSGQCMEVYSGSRTRGESVVKNACNPRARHQWWGW
jgi:hypothetical protein